MPSCFQLSASCQDFRSFTLEESAVIDALNQQLGHAPQWQQMIHNGSSNTLLTTELDSGSVVLRINAPSQLAFGVNRCREAKVLQLIQPYDWAPQVLLVDKQLRWCLMADHGSSPTDDDMSYVVPQVLAAVAEWQKIFNGPVTDYRKLYQNYRKVLSQQGNTIDLSELERLEQLHGQLPAVDDCLVHHDLHAGNVCVNNHRTVVLDWEYAGIGNPWFDGALLHRHFAISAADIHQLPAWRGLTDTEFTTGLELSSEMTEILDALWYKVRGLNC